MDEVRSRGQLRTGFNRSEMLKVKKKIERIKKSSSSMAEHKKAVSRAVESQRKEEVGETIGYQVHSLPGFFFSDLDAWKLGTIAW